MNKKNETNGKIFENFKNLISPAHGAIKNPDLRHFAYFKRKREFGPLPEFQKDKESIVKVS